MSAAGKVMAITGVTPGPGRTVLKSTLAPNRPPLRGLS
jgi:hypothetical protein